MRYVPFLLELLLSLTTSCSGGVPAGDADAAGTSDLDAFSEVAPAGFGRACATNAGCASGLCLVSDYAPFGWCTRPCDQEEVGRYCASSVDEPPAICLEYPDADGDPMGVGFRSLGDVRRFCAPLCSDASDCAALDGRFLCERPVWRGNVLLPAQSDRVCRGEEDTSPDPIVDPETCDWEPVATASPEAKVVCRDYCAYLDACKELPEGLSASCCGWSCYRRMTEGGRLDAAYRDVLTCYVDWFGALQGTGLVCSDPPRQCGGPPPIP